MRLRIALAVLLFASAVRAGGWQEVFQEKYASAGTVLAEVGGTIYAAGSSSHALSGPQRFVFTKCLNPNAMLVLSFGEGQDVALMKRMRLYVEGDAAYAAKLAAYKAHCWSALAWRKRWEGFWEGW